MAVVTFSPCICSYTQPQPAVPAPPPAPPAPPAPPPPAPAPAVPAPPPPAPVPAVPAPPPPAPPAPAPALANFARPHRASFARRVQGGGAIPAVMDSAIMATEGTCDATVMDSAILPLSSEVGATSEVVEKHVLMCAASEPPVNEDEFVEWERQVAMIINGTDSRDRAAQPAGINALTEHYTPRRSEQIMQETHDVMQEFEQWEKDIKESTPWKSDKGPVQQPALNGMQGNVMSEALPLVVPVLSMPAQDTLADHKLEQHSAGTGVQLHAGAEATKPKRKTTKSRETPTKSRKKVSTAEEDLIP